MRTLPVLADHGLTPVSLSQKPSNQHSQTKTLLSSPDFLSLKVLFSDSLPFLPDLNLPLFFLNFYFNFPLLSDEIQLWKLITYKMGNSDNWAPNPNPNPNSDPTHYSIQLFKSSTGCRGYHILHYVRFILSSWFFCYYRCCEDNFCYNCIEFGLDVSR